MPQKSRQSQNESQHALTKDARQNAAFDCACVGLMITGGLCVTAGKGAGREQHSREVGWLVVMPGNAPHDCCPL